MSSKEVGNSSKVFSQNKKNVQLSPKLIVIAILIVMVTVLLGVFIYDQYESQKVTASACANDQVLINEFTAAFNAVDTKKMQTINDQIMGRKGYKEDSSCLFMTTQTYIYLSDYKLAKQQYEALEKVYDPTYGYPASIQSIARKPQLLKDDIAFLEKLDQAQRKNSTLGGTEREN